MKWQAIVHLFVWVICVMLLNQTTDAYNIHNNHMIWKIEILIDPFPKWMHNVTLNEGKMRVGRRWLEI